MEIHFLFPSRAPSMTDPYKLGEASRGRLFQNVVGSASHEAERSEASPEINAPVLSAARTSYRLDLNAFSPIENAAFSVRRWGGVRERTGRYQSRVPPNRR